MSLDHTDGEGAFQQELTALIPRMRAFARTMCGDAAAGDDLAQDVLLRAWTARASYQPGTNLKAWLFTIMRNQFYSGKRRSWRSVPLDQELAEQTLVATSNLNAVIELDDLRRAMLRLPEEQREALILVGAGGWSYDEVAEICACAVGTVKSRVSRARSRLAQILAEASLPRDDIRPSAAMANILGQYQITHGVAPLAA